MTDSPYRAALWAAVSSAAQATPDKISLDDQIARERAASAARAWHIVVELRVPGHSREYTSLDAGMRDIAELKQLMTLGQTGKINLLVIYDTNRLRGLQSAVIKTLAAYGVQTYSLNQPLEPADPSTFRYYHSDTQAIMTHVGGLISDVEMSTLRRRYAVGMPRRVDTLGLHFNNRIPYGYRKPPGRELDRRAVAEQVPAECAVVLEIRRLYLDGMSATEIAAHLRAEKIPPPQKGWHYHSILRMICNPYYAGLVRRNLNLVRRDLMTGKKTVTPNPSDEWIVAPGQHVGLWSEDDWRRILDIRLRRGSRVLGLVKNVSHFSRLMVCKECGGTLGATTRHSDQSHVYRCMTGPSRAGHGRINEPDAIRALKAALQAVATGPITEPVDPQQSGGLELERVERAIEDNDAARARYQRLYARGGITDNDLDGRLAELAAERRVLERARADADDAAARQKRRANRIRDAADLLTQYEQLWEKPSPQVNALITEMIDVIFVSGREITDIFFRD